jgi:hypothetical protein
MDNLNVYYYYFFPNCFKKKTLSFKYRLVSRRESKLTSQFRGNIPPLSPLPPRSSLVDKSNLN